MTCAEGTIPVFHIDGDFETGVLENCGACKNEAGRETFIDGTTCSSVECDADLDCVYDDYACQSGTCVRR